MKKLVSVFVAILLLLTNITAYAGAEGKTNQDKYDGETIFRGILFGQNDVAKLFPEIWTDEKLENTENIEFREFVNNVVGSIKTNDPNYFDELEEAVYSGNHLAIHKAFDKGANLLYNAFKENEVPMMTEEMKDTAIGKCLVVVNLGAVVNAAAAVTVYAGAAVQTAVVVQDKLWFMSSNNQENKLQQEIFVQKVVERLSN